MMHLSSRLEDSGSEHVKTTHTNHTKHVDKVFRGHFEEIPQSVHVMLSSPSNWLWRYNHLVQAKLHGPLWASLDVASLIRSALRNTVLMVGGLGQRWHHVSLQVVGRATFQKWCICQADWRILGQNMSKLRTQIIQNMLIRFFGGILKRSRSLSMWCFLALQIGYGDTITWFRRIAQPLVGLRLTWPHSSAQHWEILYLR